jgi:bifunctional ADP-heptose synthase (sugar kinase/adenylyltransferase)
MATIFVNGCFDLLHEGHRRFLTAAWLLGKRQRMTVPQNRVVAAINSDRYAQELKREKWGPKYPVHNFVARRRILEAYADEVEIFDSEDELRSIIKRNSPCIICKGPDYAGRESEVTGADIAPVLILDTPETDEIREFKRKAYML